MPDGGWGDRLKDIGQDLINIEVNTILADGMTGRKMPPYPEALHDIAKRYAQFLCSPVGLDVADFFQKAALYEDSDPQTRTTDADAWRPVFNGSSDIPEELTNGARDFRWLRWAAMQVIQRHREQGGGNSDLMPEIMTIVNRIHRHSGQLELMIDALAEQTKKSGLIGVTRKDLYAALPEAISTLPDLSAVDLTRIRKIWELGVDTIVMQSVLQLDGDIIFRADKNLDLATKASLVAAHRQFVDLGVSHWRSMFELIANLMGAAIGRLLPGR